MSKRTLTEADAVDLLHGLVSIPSVSRQEAAAATWLAARMAADGYDRAYVDDAGNAVGEMGADDAARTLILLGHIDTVPGDIPVRIERGDDGDLLYGRGSVDAKGPLAAFAAAVAGLGPQWAAAHDVRLVVVGAVEEEAATSKGARFIRDRFDGLNEPVPDACIIGEPSNWRRVTLGYKGRLLVRLEASQPMAHTAGPDAGVATVAVDFWQWIADFCGQFNNDKERAFDQLLPSLRLLQSGTDERLHETVAAEAGIRLPLDYDADALASDLIAWAGARAGVAGALPGPPRGLDGAVSLDGANCAITLGFRGHEPAWRSDRRNALVRCFLAAIREVEAGARPGFVVKTGTSDMNVVGPAWRCPILAYGPGDSSLDHTPNEHIQLQEYWRAVLVLAAALRNWAASGGR